MPALSLTLRCFSVSLLLLLSACAQKAGTPSPYQGVKVGKPYTVLGQSYVPSHNPSYEEEGMASWYGPGFHGKSTANGERYDQHDMTAAHRTLPLPSLVEVTNLSNGKKTVVRVNDRGPFAHNRIIDLSKAAAQELGVVRTGTAKVRVKYLDQATVAYLKDRENHDYIAFAKTDRTSSFYQRSTLFTQNAEDENAVQTAANDNPYVTNDIKRSNPTSNNFKKDTNWFAWAGVGEANADERKSAPAGSVNSTDLPPLKGAKVSSQELPPISGTVRKTATPNIPEQVEDVTSTGRDSGAKNSNVWRDEWKGMENAPSSDDDGESAGAPILVRDKAAPVVPFGKASKPLSDEEEGMPSYSSGEPITYGTSTNTAASGQAFIQVGAFGNPSNAQKAVSKLISLGRAEIVPTGNLSRVRLGPVSADELEEVLQKVKAAGFADAKILP